MISYVHGTVLEWGNSLGIRLKRSDLAALGIGVRQKVKVRIVPVMSPLEELYGWGPKNGVHITAADIRRNRRELEGEWDR